MPIKKTASGYKCMSTGKTYKTKAAAMAARKAKGKKK